MARKTKVKFIGHIKNKGIFFEPHVRKMFKDYLATHDGEALDIVPKKLKR